MPLPKPKNNESQDDFIERCMSNNTMQKEYPDDDQRLAVCFSQWKNKEKKSMATERRYIDTGECRLLEEGNKIEGYAAVFNKWSEDLGFFRENIKKGAFKKTLEDEADVRALINHDPNLILGRTKNGTLELEEDNKGLKYLVSLPDTSYARDLRESVKRGDITQNSFGFITIQDKWKQGEGKELDERTLIEVKLLDVSPVTFPAYPQTSLTLRDAFNNIGIDYDMMGRIIMRAERGMDLTENDKDTLRGFMTILSDYIIEEEPSAEAHSEAESGPDYSTLIRMRLMKSRVQKYI